jgi:hydroxyacylglutathione hydrolase
MADLPSKPAFEPRIIKKDDLYEDGYRLKILRPNVYQFESLGAGCHVYLILGDDMNVLIDSGLISKFDSFNYLLTTEIGLAVEDIDLVINTHAHFDHISNNCYFKCPIAAHRWAATKIHQSDEMILNAKKHSIDMSDFKVHFWLEDRNIFDLGNVYLKVVETPGHTSGSIVLYEPFQKYAFTGDTFFKYVASNVYESGSVSELINSLQILDTLKMEAAFPGHGKCLFSQEEVNKELIKSIKGAHKSLDDYVDKIKRKSLDDLVIPPSLYDRDENE